jgi:hypothetical protein
MRRRLRSLFEVLQAMTMMNLKIFLKKQNGWLTALRYVARYWRAWRLVHHTAEPIRDESFSQAAAGPTKLHLSSVVVIAPPYRC